MAPSDNESEYNLHTELFDDDPVQHLRHLASLFSNPERLLAAIEAFGAETVSDVLEISASEWKELTFTYKDKSASLSPMDIHLLKIIQKWYYTHDNKAPSNILQLDKTSLKQYREQLATEYVESGSILSTPSSQRNPIASPEAKETPRNQVNSVTSQASTSMYDAFRKSVKFSAKDFEPLKDARRWQTWYRRFRATAEAQDLGNVLNPKYVPSSPEDCAVFRDQSRYLFSVFTQILMEPTSSEVLRAFTNPDDTNNYGNAQKLHSELVQRFTKGTIAITQRSALAQRIMTTRLDHGWTKSIEAFLIHFSHLIHDIRNLRNPNDTTSYNDDWAIEQLNNALSTHPTMFSHVRTVLSNQEFLADWLPADKRPTISFQTYFNNLMQHAVMLDQTGKINNRPKRNINQSTQNRSNNNNNAQRCNNRNKSNGPRLATRKAPANLKDVDVTDPTIYLSKQQYDSLSNEQKKKRYERRMEQLNKNGSRPKSANSSTASGMQVNAAQQDQSPTDNDSLQPSLCSMMSRASARSPTPAGSQNHSNRLPTYTANTSSVTYSSQSFTHQRDDLGALVDGGANGTMASSKDCVFLETDLSRTADVHAVNGSMMEKLPIVLAATQIDTNEGPIIGLFPQSAGRSDGGDTILSKRQMEAWGIRIDDTARVHGGSQCLVTNEGHLIPLNIRNGLPYLTVTKPTECDLDELPHVFFAADTPWDPSVLDDEYNSFEDDSTVPDIARQRSEDRLSQVLDDGTVNTSVHTLESILRTIRRIHTGARSTFLCAASQLCAYPQSVKPKLPPVSKLRPYFGWISEQRITDTLLATTQFYRASNHIPFRRHFRSRFPAANVRRLTEWVSTDTFFSDTPAHDDGIPGHGGCKMVQMFVGNDSYYLAGYPIRQEKEVPSALQAFVKDVGAPMGLASDNAKSEMSNAVQELLRMYCIKDRQSEAHYQWQNFMERYMQEAKRILNSILERTGCPKKFWLICLLLFVIPLLNHVVNAKGIVPYTAIFGEQADVSPFLSFHYWQEVFYELPEKKGEALGRWIGPALTKGDKLTYWVLTNDTQQLIARSNVRAAKDPLFPNLHSRPPDSHLPVSSSAPEGENAAVSQKPVVFLLSDTLPADSGSLEVPKFSPAELLGLTFLRETEDGDVLRAKVSRKIMDRDAEDNQNIKFLITCGDGDYEEIISYNELSDIIEKQHEAEANGEIDTWAFKDIVAHEGPLTSRHPKYKGSRYNVQVAWENGELTWEPLSLMIKSDPVTLAKYAKDNDLLETEGWKPLRRIAKRDKVLRRMINQVKRQSRHDAIRYKFGVRLPRSVKEAHALDQENGNTQWADAIKAEMNQLFDYSTFIDLGKDAPVPNGYKMIRGRIIFDVKESGKRKARYVAGGHLTDPPKDSVYSSVVSLRSVRLVTFLSELNGLKLMAADVGNAYLEAFTQEKICIKAGSEFGELAGHTLVVDKALYGLRSSGKMFRESFADTLTDFGFSPCYADPDVWIRDAGDVYEYVTTWVDDLLVAMKDPKSFMDKLQSAPYNYKLKGVDEPKYLTQSSQFRYISGVHVNV